jgi:hypothetical protein
MVLLNTAAAVAAGILTTGLAAVGVGTVGHSDSAAPTTQTVQTSQAAQGLHCHAALKKLPAALRTDLKKARALPVGQRGKALHAIREKALHGDYGTKAQQWSEHRFKHQARVAAQMPKQMRTDLRAVHKLPTAQRPAARKAIRAKALSGGYGDAVQRRAERVKEHRAACAKAKTGTQS